MASVAELKDTLVTEQTRLAELSEKSIQAISTQLTLSSWVLGVLAVVLALIGIIGWATLHRAAIARSENMAKDHLDIYMKGDEFKSLITEKVDAQLQKEWQSRLVSLLLDQSDKQSSTEPSPFPAATKKGAAQ